MKAIEFDHVGKLYRLGTVGTGTLTHDLNRWWNMRVLHREDPFMKVGETNDRATRGHSHYVWALRDISFSVEQGDVVGIIGKNGAGKSTLLKLLSQITTPTTGVIRARGRIGSLLEVGTGFHPEMTGRENIFMNGSIMGMTRHEISSKLDAIVDFAGVARYIDTPVKRYSSGMTVRLGFAVAAFMEPEILVVDEVLAVGDAEFQKKAIGKMQDVSRSEGRTVLFVSHNMAAVKNLCSRGIVLQNGSVAFNGHVDNALDYYMTTCYEGISQMPIAEMPRSGKPSGRLQFNSIEFLDREGRAAIPTCGRFLRIRVGFMVHDELLNDVKTTVEIHDFYEHPLIYFDSQFTTDNRSFSRGQHHITIDIERLPLTEGNYKILLWAEAMRRVADYLDCTIAMTVADGKFFPNKQFFPSHLKGKLVLEEYTWSYDKE